MNGRRMKEHKINTTKNEYHSLPTRYLNDCANTLSLVGACTISEQEKRCVERVTTKQLVMPRRIVSSKPPVLCDDPAKMFFEYDSASVASFVFCWYVSCNLAYRFNFSFSCLLRRVYAELLGSFNKTAAVFKTFILYLSCTIRNKVGLSAVQTNILSNDGAERSPSVAALVKLAKLRLFRTNWLRPKKAAV